MTRALRRALDALAKSAPLSEMEALLARGDINAAIGLLLDTGAAPARAILTQGVSEAVIAAGHAAFTKGAAGLLIKRSVSSFGLVSTRAAEAVNTVALQFFPPIFKDTEVVLRKVFADGLREGINPRTIAIKARQYVGLTEYDHHIIGTFRDALRRGDYTAVMQRTLRDKRFDAQIKAARAGTPTGPGEIFNTFRGVNATATPNDFGALGKGRYSSGSRQVAEAYAGRGGTVSEMRITLHRPLKTTYAELTALQERLYGQVVTGFDPVLATKFDQYLVSKGYDGVVTFDNEISRIIPQEVVQLANARRVGAPLTEAQIEKMTERYGERLLKWRAETWSRSATLNAMRNGEQAAWREAADIAGVVPDQIVKTWSTTIDGKEREEHHAADGTTVGIDEEYPVDGGVMVPGDGVYNCRCISVFAVLPVNKATSREFLARDSMKPRGEREAIASLRGASRL